MLSIPLDVCRRLLLDLTTCPVTHSYITFYYIVDLCIYVCLVYVIFGPILWGHSGPLCHALSLSLLLLLLSSLWTSVLHCHSPGVATVTRRLRYSYSWLRLILVVVSTVATPGEWQCKIRTGGVRRLAVANGPNIFKCFLLSY